MIGLATLSACGGNAPASVATLSLVATGVPSASAPPTATPSVAPTQTPTAVPSATAVPPTATATARVVSFEQLKPQMDAIMGAFMQSNKVSGCSLSVAAPDPNTSKVQSRITNYGALATGSKTPVDVTTEYEIGSLSKLFTADLLALFVRDGVMRLDDLLQKYMPATIHAPTYNGRAITLRDLATHTSGLPRRNDNVPQLRMVNGVLTWGYASADELLAFLNAYKLTRAPGAQWEYSNLAFALLGMAEEKAGGSTFENLVLSKIGTPLGLRDTRVVLSAGEKARLAQGYAANGEKAPPIAVSGEALAAGALRSTIQDLATYLVANIDPDATKLESVLALTQQPQAKGPSPSAAAGLGWNIIAQGTAREQFSKDGATAGFEAYIAFARASRSGFVVVCNGHNVNQGAAPQLQKLFGEFEFQVDDSE